MQESKLKLIIHDRYLENPILNYLEYWIIGNKSYPTSEKLFRRPYNDLTPSEKEKLRSEYEKWRKMYDLDVIWLEGDLNADTIFSLWMPLKMSLQCLNPNYFKTKGFRGYPAKTPYNYKMLQKNIENLLPRDDFLVKELYNFAELAATRANVMRLPDRGMQNRGKYFDQMPKTLFECFDGGEFSVYFNKNNDKVLKWIKEEKLKMFFEGDVISKKCIKPLISNLHPYQFKWLEEKNEIIEMLKQYSEILTNRSELIK